MSETTSRGAQETPQLESAVVTKQPRGTRRRWVGVGVAVIVVLAAAVGGAAYAGVFSSKSSSAQNTGAPAPATSAVTRQTISSTTPESATLGYAGSYTVIGQGGGTLTSLPASGAVITQGQVLYRTDNGTPTVLLYGSIPAWRTMTTGTIGNDVTQLNHDLVALGYANSSDISALGWDYYSWETRYAVEQLEEARGVEDPSGSLTLGSVVFKPEALRVSNVTASLGSPASGPIFSATSQRHIVTIALSTSMESVVKAGDPVSVTLPNGSTASGVVTSVGTVATGTSSSATIPVYVSLIHPSDAGSLNQAPVTVYLTTGSASNVLAVPISALLAQPGGGYAVEAIGPNNTRHLVRVTVGTIDDNSGYAQVTGNLVPGERVVVPSS